MKKLFILIAVCLMSGITYAQLKKGEWITTLNGNASLSGSGSSYINRSFTVNPGLMKLVGHNFAIGLKLGSSYQHTELLSSFQPPVKNSTLELEPAVVLRKYFGGYRLKPYAQVDLGWQIRTYNNYSVQLDDMYRIRDNNAFVRPVAGLSYWLSDKVSLDANAGYDINFEHNRYIRDWQFNLGFTVKFGKPSEK